MSRRNAPEVNAGSMADIAFLLLIFFLVTTTIDKDTGLFRQLPAEKEINTIVTLHERNVFEIKIGKEGDLFVENELLPLSDLKVAVMAFIDNGGLQIGSDKYCSYCKGLREASSSDSPQDAIVSISSHREAPYESYIAVQNELTAAYMQLRNREAQRLFSYDYSSTKKALDEGLITKEIDKTKKELLLIRDLFPMLISEAEIKAIYN